MNLEQILEYEIVSLGSYTLTPYEILRLLILLIVAWISISVANRLIKARIKTGRFDKIACRKI